MALTVLKNTVVLAFDVCSSTDIFESLAQRGEQQKFWHCLRDIKRYLADVRKDKPFPFDAYKFTGDGWILFFPSNVDGMTLLEVLRDLALFYQKYFSERLEPYIDTLPGTLGLTFGIEKGSLAPMKFFGKEEYVGRPLIMATRLQGAIGVGDVSPADKVLASKAVYKEQFAAAHHTYKVVDTDRDLKNVGKGPVSCKLIHLLEPAVQKSEVEA
jgi:hypothetical protein